MVKFFASSRAQVRSSAFRLHWPGQAKAFELQTGHATRLSWHGRLARD